MRERSKAALTVAFVALLLLGGGVPPQGDAAVFYARSELPALAFPEAERVETKNIFLTAEQHRRIEKKARATVDSRFLTVYIGHRGSEILGYALLDTHTVRSLPETFLVVLDAGGRVSATHVLAFYEPLEYLPSPRWLEQLQGRALNKELAIGRSLAAITGSTLTSRAVVGGVRRALAVYEIVVAEGL